MLKMIYNEEREDALRDNEIAITNNTQATASLMAAADKVTPPIFVSFRGVSLMILANTGKAVMDSAVPMNTKKLTNCIVVERLLLTLSGICTNSNNNGLIAIPRANGTSIEVRAMDEVFTKE